MACEPHVYVTAEALYRIKPCRLSEQNSTDIWAIRRTKFNSSSLPSRGVDISFYSPPPFHIIFLRTGKVKRVGVEASGQRTPSIRTAVTEGILGSWVTVVSGHALRTAHSKHSNCCDRGHTRQLGHCSLRACPQNSALQAFELL
jgi:hypothetical protein